MTRDLREVPFKRWHYRWLMEQADKAEGGIAQALTDDLLAVLERSDSRTCVVDGDPVACGGVLKQWPGRYIAWAYVARGSLPHMPWITECVRRGLERTKGRIEITVRKDFRPGQRWARQLGFVVEAPVLRAYGPEGEDHVGYARVN